MFTASEARWADLPLWELEMFNLTQILIDDLPEKRSDIVELLSFDFLQVFDSITDPYRFVLSFSSSSSSSPTPALTHECTSLTNIDVFENVSSFTFPPQQISWNKEVLKVRVLDIPNPRSSDLLSSWWPALSDHIYPTVPCVHASIYEVNEGRLFSLSDCSATFQREKAWFYSVILIGEPSQMRRLKFKHISRDKFEPIVEITSLYNMWIFDSNIKTSVSQFAGKTNLRTHYFVVLFWSAA